MTTRTIPGRAFSFDPEEYRARYAEQGWVHIREAIDPGFLEYLRDHGEQQLAATPRRRFASKANMRQALLEFPEGGGHLAEMFDAVSAVCCLQRPAMTLAERHIQAYEPDAEPDPLAHKDRFPAQVSLSIAVASPPGSQLVLYPDDGRELNSYNDAAVLRRYLQPHEKPEAVLASAQEIVVDHEAGDLVLFPGCTMWHLRRNAAGAVDVTIEMNDFDRDPLGEDPATAARRQRTLELLADDAGALGEYRPVVARRLDYVGRRSVRPNGDATLHYVLHGQEPFGLTQTQLELLRVADGKRSLDSVIAEISPGRDAREVRRDALVLIADGGLDLLSDWRRRRRALESMDG